MIEHITFFSSLDEVVATTGVGVVVAHCFWLTVDFSTEVAPSVRR